METSIFTYSQESKNCEISAGKVMTIIFNYKGIMYQHAFELFTTANDLYYTNVLRIMIQLVKRKRPWLRNGFLLHHDNAQPYISHCVLDVSQQNKVEILPHPPYSPDLTSCDFWLFPQLKEPLRGTCFASNKACDRFLVNVWAGILGDHLIGPYILPDRLNGPRYLIFLEQVLPELLDSAHVTAATRTSVWFQQDGAPAHFSISVRNHLDATCGERWIGRGGLVHWPPRSPDFSCLDYFFWGQMKSLVYETPVNSAEELVARISATAGEIRNTPEMLSNVRRSMKRRCEACITCGGCQFEHLL
ncbi:uncharacterized protein TNCV_603031 [Trichonephila clavipes]|nr:uncharacterized protein TNCV_603031 [Trichonephila clavipes]